MKFDGDLIEYMIPEKVEYNFSSTVLQFHEFFSFVSQKASPVMWLPKIGKDRETENKWKK